MFLLRLLFVVLAALFVRRLLRRAFAPTPGRRPTVSGSGTRPARGTRDLNDQDIADADFEEIP